MKPYGTLELDEDLPFQRLEWRLERIGWGILLLLVVGAIAGLFGAGLFSEQTIVSPNGKFAISCSRMLRAHKPSFLEVEFRDGGSIELSLSEEVMRSWNIQQVTPEPEEVIAGPSQTTFRFHGTAPGRVVIEYKAKSAGSLLGKIELPEGALIDVHQFAFP